MSTLRINNIEAKSVPASPTLDEKIKLTNSSGDVLVHIDGKNSGITTIGINTTASNITFDANSNIVVTGIITATKFVGTIEPTNLTVSGDLTIADKIIHAGDTNTAIRFPAADKITLETSGTERFQVDSSGNVYVGGVGASATAGVLWLNDTSANASKISQDNGNSALVFGTGSGQVERLRITSGGQIFIGGNTGYNESASLISLATDDSAAANMLSDSSAIYNHTNPAFIHVQNRYNTGDGQEAGIIFHSKSSFNGSWAIYGKKTTSGFLSDLIFRNRTASSTSAERLRIGSAGQIGLGGANYGTAGQVLTSQGSGSAVQWASIYNERYTVSNITGTSQINVTNLGNDPHEICINFHMLKGVSDPCAILLRLGTSGGLNSSMVYNQTWTYFNNTSSNVLSNSRNHDQNAFWLYNNNFTSPLNIYSGNITLRRTIIGTYLLAGSAMSDRSENNNQYSNFTNGRVDISGACTQLRIYVDNGTNFAQGSVTVRTID